MKLAIGVKAFILNDKGEVLILREAKYEEGTNEGKWDVPGGRILPEEKLADGLRREVLEECGLEVEMDELLHVQENFTVIKGEEFHIVRVFYKAKYLGGEVKLSADHAEYRWVSSKDLQGKSFVLDVKEVILSLV